jgi:hypothetical protein
MSSSYTPPTPTPGVAIIHADLNSGTITMSNCPPYAPTCPALMMPSLSWNGSLAAGTVAASATDYFGLGPATLSGTISVWVAPIACNLRNLYIQTTTTQTGGALTFQIYDNGTTPTVLGTPTGIVLTVASSQGAGIPLQDSPLYTYVTTAGNTYTIQAINSSASTSAGIGAWGVACTPF